MNSIEKGNIGEEFVNSIAYNSFMRFWCYPSPKDEEGDKKEICDLLIIFGKSIIILSVKNYEFKNNYSRYFKKTIDKAVRQIYGAERKLFKSNRDIFIKHPDKAVERFPKENIKAIHRVIINLGEGVKFYPFQKETKEAKFISLFDKDAFKEIVRELDTIPDFIEYLVKRETLFKDKSVLVLPGEENDFPEETSRQFFEHSQQHFNPLERTSILLSGTEHDLLAHYLKNERNFPKLLHSEKYNGGLMQIDGSWNEFIAKKQVQKKKEKDQISYFIDKLVENEVLGDQSSQSQNLARELLSFDRFQRRIVAKSFWSFYHRYGGIKKEYFARRYLKVGDVSVVFAYYTPDSPAEMVNDLLNLALDSFCIYSQYESTKMVLIATTLNLQQFKIGFMGDILPFSEEDERQIMENAKKMGWFQNINEGRLRENEYPEEE